MTQAVRYQKARLRYGVEGATDEWREVLPSEILNRPPKGDLICSGCSMLMKFTSSFTRAGNEVPAYLSLYPHTEHAEDCLLELETKRAGRNHYASGLSEADPKNFFLHLPDEVRVRNRQSDFRRTGGHSSKDTNTETLNNAQDIARFLKRDDAGDRNELQIRYRDHRGGISVMFWDDFCFKAHSPYALKHLRRLERDGDRTPPIAVIFRVKDPGTNDSLRFMRFDTGTRPHPDDTTHKLFLSVAEALVPDRALLTDLTAEEILVLGRPTFFDWTNQPRTEMRIVIKDRWQIAPL